MAAVLETGGQRKPLLGIVVGLLVATVVAFPAFASIVGAYASFSGCFLECSQPEPLVGVLWATVAVVLLALPVVAGAAAAGFRSPLIKIVSVAAVMVGVCWIVFTVMGAV